MQAVDKQVSSMAVFNKKDDQISGDFSTAFIDENDGGASGNTSV
jgi:hypothetical protein